jgi:hypothetical protein
MFETINEDGGNRPQSAGQARQQCTDGSAGTHQNATGSDPKTQRNGGTGGMAESLAALPSDWRLVRVGRSKAPIAGDNWFDRDNYSPDDALALNGSSPPAWGLKSGPCSGVLVLDLDAEGWRGSFQRVTGHPITDLPPTIGWTSGKPDRSGHAFQVDPDWWPHLLNRQEFTRPWREGDPLRKDGSKGAVTLWELRWDKHQAVIIGAHPETGAYRWLPGRSPHEIPDPAPAPDWLLEHLLVQELPKVPRSAPSAADAERAVAMLQKLPPDEYSDYTNWLRVGMALHHTDAGLLTAWVDWCRPMATFDEAECLRKWESFGKGHKGRQATIGTLYYLAKKHGYREPRRKRNQQAPSAATAASAQSLRDLTTDQWRRVFTELLNQPESLFNNQWQDCPLCGSANDFKGQEMDPGYHMICNNCGGMDSKGGMLTECDFVERILQLDRNAAKDRVARFLGVQPPQAAPAASTAGSPPPAAEPLPKAPYRVLGWSTKLDAIWVQTGEDGIVGSVPLSKAGLQRIAPIGYWEALAPGRFGTDWDAAISKVRDTAVGLGTFTPDRIRGRGVWLDNDRVIWHLGNRIEVDGRQLRLTELRDSAYTYASLPALDINPEVPQLTDVEGTAILDLFTKRLKWGNDGDGLLVAGHTVLGNVCAALDYRPGLQLTGGSGDGKSTTQNKSIAPLQAGLALRTSGATEAGIRQTMGIDALPVVIDESEQENARQREGHLHLLRLSFDGQQQVKGTPGGKSLTYTMRSMITLIGINAAVPNPADRNRLVVIRPRKLQPEAWREFQLQRDKLITIEAGRRLIRRTVSNLPALLANIKTFTAVLASQKGTDRTHQVIGSLLAGAHHLTSSAVLDPDAALAWLDAVGWSGLDEDALEATSADAEAKACSDHLLGHTVQWKGTQTGSITVLELLTIAKASPGATEAISALGRLGIKWDRERELVVANSCKVYAGSKWANGNHRDHLLSLDKAQAVTSATRFPGWKVSKGVSVPWDVVDPPEKPKAKPA